MFKLLVVPVIIIYLLLVGVWKILSKIFGVFYGLGLNFGLTTTWSKKSKKAHFHVIPYSHFCEKARLALDVCKVDYVEHQVGPVLHMFSTLYNSNGTGTSAPLLVTNDKKIIHDSGDILKYLHESGHSWLYPNFKEVRALEEYIDKEIGVHIRRAGYYHLTKDPKLLEELIMRNMHGIQKTLLQFFFFPIFLPMMIKSMNIYEKPAEKSFERVFAALEKLSDMLSDGRKNLLDTPQYSAADITFSSLMYVVTCPSSMETVYLSSEKLNTSSSMAPYLKKIKEYPAFSYALKVHNDLRGKEKMKIKSE